MEYWNNGFKRLEKSIYCRGLIYQARSVEFMHGFDESNREASTIGMRIKDIEDRKRNRRIVFRCNLKNENR
jgi:tRNA A-37 threonylcarbamoyl transferase component Bud32